MSEILLKVLSLKLALPVVTLDTSLAVFTVTTVQGMLEKTFAKKASSDKVAEKSVLKQAG